MFLNGEMKIINKEHINYNEICKAIAASDEVALSKLISAKNHTLFDGKVKLSEDRNSVIVNGKFVHTTLAKRIIEFAKKGLPYEPLQKFLENCEKNPNPKSIEELYDFLENRGIPITEDGHFLSYKAVRADFKDKYTGTIDNSVGNIVEFDITQVDNDRSNQCSFGLHVGALEYVSSYGSGANDVWLLCKVNPMDAVAVPLDHKAQKIRVRKYEVLQVIEKDLSSIKDASCYSVKGDKAANEESYKDFMWKLEEENKTYLEEQKEKLLLRHTLDSITSEALNAGVFSSIEQLKNLTKEEICELLVKLELV